MGFDNVNVNVSGPVQPTSTYKTKVLKGNHSFASQVTEPNVKYVIKYDFNLGGGSVTIPEGCLLEFDGGSISNGTLVGQNTILIYNQKLDTIFHTVTRQGTFVYNNIVSADEEDITEVGNILKLKDRGTADGMGKIILRKNKTFAEQLTQENTIYVIQYDFTLGEDITVPENCVLEFDGGSFSNVTKLQIQSNSVVRNGKITFADNSSSCLIIVESNNVTVENCSFSKKLTNEPTIQAPFTYCVYVGSSTNIKIRNCSFDIVDKCYGIYFGNQSYLCEISGCEIIGRQDEITEDWTGDGILINKSDNIRVENSHIKNTSLGIYVLPLTGDNTNITIEDNHIEEVIDHGICFYHPVDDYFNHDCTVISNHIHHCYGHSNDSFGTGIYILNSYGFIVNNNTIHDVCINSEGETLAPAGIGVNESDDCTVSNNLIYDSGRHGIIADGNNVIVHGNYIHDCDADPLAVRKNLSNIVISNNIIVTDSDSSCILFSSPNNCNNVTISSNVLVNSSGGNCLNGSLDSSTVIGNVAISNGTPFNCDLTNSIVVGNRISSGNATVSMYGSYSHCIVTGNHIENTSTGTHLRIYDVSNGTITSGNFFDDKKDADVLPTNQNMTGTTSARPTNPDFGVMYMDTTLNKPIWWNGTDWVDATGTPV